MRSKKSDRLHENFLRRAIELSRKKMNSDLGGPFGAVIVKNGRIIAEGWNKVTSANDPTAHAEIDCIRKACKILKNFSLKGCVIYTSCEPCPMCLAAIYWAHLDRIYFANTRKDAAKIDFDDSKIYSEIKKSINSRSIKMIQLLRPEANTVFQMWARKSDRIPY